MKIGFEFLCVRTLIDWITKGKKYKVTEVDNHGFSIESNNGVDCFFYFSQEECYGRQMYWCGDYFQNFKNL